MSLAVGIDVGAYKCAAAVCRPAEREAERRVLNITTQRGGFGELDAWMAKQGAPVDVVVMESSGHYWFNVASHLRRQGYPVALVNPLQAKYFAKSRLQRSKSDPADARTLAALGTRDQPRITSPWWGPSSRRRHGSQCAWYASRHRSASASSGWWTSAFRSCARSGTTPRA